MSLLPDNTYAFKNCLTSYISLGHSAQNQLSINLLGQFVERSLPIPEVHGSNRVIGKNLYRIFSVKCIKKT